MLDTGLAMQEAQQQPNPGMTPPPPSPGQTGMQPGQTGDDGGMTGCPTRIRPARWHDGNATAAGNNMTALHLLWVATVIWYPPGSGLNGPGSMQGGRGGPMNTRGPPGGDSNMAPPGGGMNGPGSMQGSQNGGMMGPPGGDTNEWPLSRRAWNGPGTMGTPPNGPGMPGGQGAA